MDPRNVKRAARSTKGPEAIIQTAIIRELKAQDWYVKVMVGNIYQYGVPDLYVAHRSRGQRWIEVKNPKSYSFTPAQAIEFPLLSNYGVGIWILFSVDDIHKLSKPANWQEYFLRWQSGAT